MKLSYFSDQLLGEDDVIEKVLSAGTCKQQIRRSPQQLQMFGTMFDEVYSQLKPEEKKEFNQEVSSDSTSGLNFLDLNLRIHLSMPRLAT